MTLWKDHLRTFKLFEQKSDRFNWLKSVLNVKLNEKEYSDFFKFLTEIVKIDPETLGIVIERIKDEWQQDSSSSDVLLFKSTVSFLGRLKKSVRRQEFKGKISRLWPVIFSFPAQERLKLHLVREYRRELSFGWLYEFALRDEFFYNENLNVEVLDTGAMAALDILMELLDKTRGDEELMDELRISGLLEKIGSLWRSPALPKIIKLLAMASSIALNNIFDSLPCFMDALIERGCICIWTVRLVDSILRKYSKRQYVLSQSRAELNSISRQVIKIASKSIDFYAESAEMNKSICGLLRRVLERWEGMACSAESEMEFCEKVSEFLEISYKRERDSNNQMNLLTVFANNFIDPLIPQITFFFRNSIKLSVTSTVLSSFANVLVNDGGTDRSFPLLFKEYPSLIENVHEIISKSKGDEMHQLFWLLILAESSRTKKVLIDFLIDPKQINEMESNEFWISFMGKLTNGNGFDEVNRWSNGELLKQFLPRAKSLVVFDDNFMNLLKLVMERLPSVNDKDLLFVLVTCKSNIPTFDWLLSRFDCKSIILNNLNNFIPVSKRIYEIVRNDLMSIEEIIDGLFQSRDEALLIKSMSQWKLLVETEKVTLLPDEQLNKKSFFTEDYGNYLEKLFEGIQTSPAQLIKESNDPIEMFLEYYKYGQIRPMKLLQDHLLFNYRCSELLLRIPITVLRASGPDFGGIILDSLISWDDEDVDIVMNSPCNEYSFDLLKMYYKTRINK